FLYGGLLGLRVPEIRGLLPAVAEFSGLEHELDSAIKNYSSGMVARLGFAIATASRPEVLLVDEVLAVGDETFRHRCRQRIAELRAAGTAVVLVSHDLELVEAEATAAIWLGQGRVLACGRCAEVVGEYRRSLSRCGVGP
ncbi:MAG: ABC transporter ATP-binding protein, partial [Candidatus Binatia bacterium]